MKCSFYNAFVLFLASLALCVGCSTEGGGPFGSGADGGGSEDPVYVSVTEKDGSQTDAPFYKEYQTLFSLSGKTPDQKPVNFYVGGGYAPGLPESRQIPKEYQTPEINTADAYFINTTEFFFQRIVDIDHEDEFYVTAIRKGFLFAPWHVTVVGKKSNLTVPVPYTHEWGEGEWGLAPNGMYVDSYDGEAKKISTKISYENGKVRLILPIGGSAIYLTGNTFYGESQEATQKIFGKISDDMTVIEYHAGAINGIKFFDGTLTLIK